MNVLILFSSLLSVIFFEPLIQFLKALIMEVWISFWSLFLVIFNVRSKNESIIEWMLQPDDADHEVMDIYVDLFLNFYPDFYS